MGCGHDVEIFDITTIDGLAEASFYSVQTTPYVVIESRGRKFSAPTSTDGLSRLLNEQIENAGLLGNCLNIIEEEP